MAEQKQASCGCGCGCSPVVKEGLPLVPAGELEKGRKGEPG